MSSNASGVAGGLLVEDKGVDGAPGIKGTAVWVGVATRDSQLFSKK